MAVSKPSAEIAQISRLPEFGVGTGFGAKGAIG